MKVLKTIGLLVAFACIGVAGWRLSQFYGTDDAARPQAKTPGPGNRPPPPKLDPLPKLVKPNTYVLSSIPKPLAPEMSDADWRQAYPVYVAGLDRPTAITPIAIPWRFGATEPAFKSEAPLAQAMAFLVGSDLAWCPAAYDVPAAFAVFRLGGDQETDIDSLYEPSAIAARVKKWNGTHAIGGVVVRAKDGYVATLQIFDASGKVVHESAMERPGTFFTLLGDVSAETLKYFGAPANDALVQHLRRVRCQKPDSLTALGRTAFLPSTSNADSGVYDAILRNDGGFAEVRYWRAVRRAQLSAGAVDPCDDLKRALTDAVHLGVLAELGQMESPKSVAGRDISGWIDAAETLAGKEHPDVLAIRLKQIEGARPNPWAAAATLQQLRPYARLAVRYSHHTRLIDALLQTQETDADGVAACELDPEMTASLALARIFNPRQPEFGLADHWRQVAEAARARGRYGHVVAACRRMQGQRDSLMVDATRQFLEASAAMQSGDFSRAADLFSALTKRSSSSRWRERAAQHAAFCAVLAGRKEMIEAMAIDPAASSGSVGSFLAVGIKYMDGDVVDRSGFMHFDRKQGGDILLAECELFQGGDFTRSDRERVWMRWTQSSEPDLDDRLRWVLLERYYRAQPNLQHWAGFYEAAEWERPDDPAVKEAVERWRQRGGDRSLPTSEKLASLLRARQWSGNERPPVWQAVARVRRDLEEGRVDDARNVVNALAERPGSGDTTRLAWLMRKVETAMATQPAKPTP